MKTLAVIALALLAGCTSFSKLEPQLAELRGQPLQVAFDRYGIPNREYEVAGQKAYEWSTNRVNPFNNTGPMTGCAIRVMAAEGVIRTTNYDGQNGACFAFVR